MRKDSGFALILVLVFMTLMATSMTAFSVYTRSTISNTQIAVVDAVRRNAILSAKAWLEVNGAFIQKEKEYKLELQDVSSDAACIILPVLSDDAQAANLSNLISFEGWQIQVVRTHRGKQTKFDYMIENGRIDESISDPNSPSNGD